MSCADRPRKEKGKLSIQLEKDYRKLIDSFRKDWTYEKDGKIYLGAEGKDVRADALEYFFANDMAVILAQAKTEAKIEVLEEVLSEVECWKVHYLDTTKNEPSKEMQKGLVKVIKKWLSNLKKKKK